MLAREASFVVVDTETTGSNSSRDRIIEIGAVRVQAGKIVDRFQQLINPDCAVPRRITWITGISTAMVFDKPAVRYVMPRFTEFLGASVFVAHNLAFDLSFVNGERMRLESAPIPNDTLCTLRLARRLLPGLRSKSLASLTDFYRIRIQRRHRALEDAEATAEVLVRFLDHLDLQFGSMELSDVLSFQYRRYGQIKKATKHVTHIRENVLSALPESPGVYFMKDSRRRTIYVGKALNLRNRVRSYFTSIEGHPARIRKMVKAVRNVEWQETSSELEALLLESQLIKKLKPTYNRAQVQYVNRPFVRLDTTHKYPRVTCNAFLHDDGAEYYGPLATRGEAKFVVDVIDRFFQLRECDDVTFSRGKRCLYASLGRCLAPCEEKTDRYRFELDRVRAFLTGRDWSVIERIGVAMRAAAAELDYEQAGIYRDWQRWLERVLTKREAIATRVLDHNAVIIHRPPEGAVRLLVISRGRHAETISLEEESQDVALETLRTAVTRRFGNETNGPDTYREREIDEVYLLAHWLYVHRHEVAHVRWEDREQPDALVRRVRLELAPGVPAEPTSAQAALALQT
jgi:DNA polymerase-3 subunit epsilon